MWAGLTLWWEALGGWELLLLAAWLGFSLLVIAAVDD
jgi:hypothetical protein